MDVTRHYDAASKVSGLKELFDYLQKKKMFPEKKLYPPPPVEDIDFFEVGPSGFPVKFTVTPWNFPFFCIDPPGNVCFFLNVGVPPWNSNDFYSTLLEFSIDILNYNFFLEKPKDGLRQ